MSAKNKANEIQIIRIYDAPRKVVWEAWTDPAKVAKWWGPRGFTLTTHSKDLRSGGTWNYTMHGPDGTDYRNITKYLEVKEHSLLIYDHGGNENSPPLFRVTVHFSDYNGKTKMDMTMSLATAEAAKEIKAFVKKAGGNATWDRLAEYIEQQDKNKEIFVINRSIVAPIEKVFEVWSNPKHLANWLSPTGFNMTYIEADLQCGGSTFYSMSNDKLTIYGQAHYLEITPNKRIVYTQQFCDKDKNPSRHPLAPLLPQGFLTTVEFHEQGPEETRITIRWEVHGKATQEEIAFFVASKAGMTQGWSGSFEKLENYLNTSGF